MVLARLLVYWLCHLQKNDKGIKMSYQLYKSVWVFRNSPDKEQELSRKDACTWLEQGGMMLRNTYNFDCKEITRFWYVIKDSFDGYEELSRNTRNQVRKGYKNFTIKPISKTLLLQSGYAVFRQAIMSYKVKARLVDEKTFMETILNLPDNAEFWGAFSQEDDRLSAYAINRIWGNDHCNYSVLKGTPEALQNYAYYALIFEMNKHYLEDRKMRYVLDGARSITEHSNIQPFLMEKFHFRKAYSHLHIYTKGWLKPILFIGYHCRKLIPVRSIRSVLEMYGMQG